MHSTPWLIWKIVPPNPFGMVLAFFSASAIQLDDSE